MTKAKHIEVDKHFIKEKNDSGVICMLYILTINHVVDALMKGLHNKQFESLVSKLTMEDIFKSVCGGVWKKGKSNWVS